MTVTRQDQSMRGWGLECRTEVRDWWTKNGLRIGDTLSDLYTYRWKHMPSGVTQKARTDDKGRLLPPLRVVKG